jgi:hypothetical protein
MTSLSTLHPCLLGPTCDVLRFVSDGTISSRTARSSRQSIRATGAIGTVGGIGESSRAINRFTVGL